MSDFTIVVIGTGVIGTSIGLALKKSDTPLRLLAHDKELGNAQAAVKAGAFDKAEWNLINACEQASLIVLAIPLNGITPTLEAIAPYLAENIVVTDVCSSKAPVVEAAQKFLPDHVHFIGGHPIVYPTGVGHSYATDDLFKDRLYCLTPGSNANEEAVQLLSNVVKLLDGTAFFLDASEHDGLMTAIEYLPTVLSASLLNALTKQGSWRETRKLAGRMFEQVSAGAEGDPDGLKDALLSNRDNVLNWLDQFVVELAHLRRLIAEADDAEGEEALAQALDKAVVERHNWQLDFQQNRFVDPELVPADVESPNLLRRWIGFGR